MEFCQLRKLTTRTAGARVDPVSESWIVRGGCLFQASDTLRTLSVFIVSRFLHLGVALPLLAIKCGRALYLVIWQY